MSTFISTTVTAPVTINTNLDGDLSEAAGTTIADVVIDSVERGNRIRREIVVRINRHGELILGWSFRENDVAVPAVSSVLP